LGLVSYCLVIYYQNERSGSAGMITVLINRVGDIGIILRLIFIVNFSSWSIIEYCLSKHILYSIGALIILGAITKRAQIPFSAWLPAAIAAPTPVSALVHSSTLVTAGVYLIIRMSQFYTNGHLRYLLIYLSILTIFISGLAATLENDLKKVIALSTLSQLGVIMIILSVGQYTLAYFHLLTHAIFKAILFLCAGVVIHRIEGKQDIRDIGLIFYLNPVLRACIALSRISLIGFPFLRGFYSKDIIIEIIYILNNRILIIIIICVSLIFTVFYSLRLLYYSILSRGVAQTTLSSKSDSMIVSPILIIGIFVVFIGSILRWLSFPHLIFIHLTLFVKLITLFIITISIILFNLILINTWKSSEIKSYFHFWGIIWFLPYISSLSFINFIKNREKLYYLSDQGWIEEWGSQGFYNFFTSNLLILSYLQFMVIKKLIIAIIILVITYICIL